MAVDPNIKQKANNIRTKQYGSEVRESLATGLESMSEDVVDVKGRQLTVEGQFQTVIEETTGKDVISAPEIIAARGTHSNLSQRLFAADQQLAETASQSELNAVSSNVANIIAHNGDGTKDTEVVALRTDNKGNVYTTAPDRVNAIEDDVDSKITEPPSLLSVPLISDTLNLETGLYTKNVSEIELSGTQFLGITKDKTNYDYIYTGVISDAKKPVLGTDTGMSVLTDKNGNVLEETANSDKVSDIGKYTYNTNPRIWIYVPKGKYESIEEARIDLGTMKLRYQLETPVVTVEKIGTLTNEIVKIRKNTDGKVFEKANERVDDVENKVSNFTKYLTPQLIQPPALLSVPTISDTFSDGVLTKNVERIALGGTKFLALVTTELNHDAVYTEVIPFSKIGTGGISGKTVLLDKNSIPLTETSSTDDASNIGKYAHRNNGRIWIYVPKGKYTNIGEARTDLGTMSLNYQLETPIISKVDGGIALDISEKRDFSINVNTIEEIPIYFSNVPDDENIILAVTLHIKNSVLPNLTFPSGTLWKNGKRPSFEIGKTHMLYLVSYDNGVSWLGAKTGEW